MEDVKVYMVVNLEIEDKDTYLKYEKGFLELGLKLFSGDGGFYHWCKLPDSLTAEKLNEKLFKKGAAILKGADCDMHRLGDNSHLKKFFRFSFGPLFPDSYDNDIKILGEAINSKKG